MTTTTTEENDVAAPVTCTPESSDVEDDGVEERAVACAADDTERTEDDDDASASSTIPEEFICPLTLEIFTDPLMDRRGTNWERSAILEWLNRGNTTCPLTREPMGFRSLIPNVNLRTRVEHWKRDNGYDIGRSPSNSPKRRWETDNVVAYIEAPPGSTLELQYTQTYMQARAAAIVRRMERREAAARQQQQAQESTINEETSRRSRGRRRRLSLTRPSTPTGYSPATQQRRLAGLLGEALSIVRRPPLASAED